MRPMLIQHSRWNRLPPQQKRDRAHLGVVSLPDVEDGFELAQEAVLQVLGGEAEQPCVFPQLDTASNVSAAALRSR